MKLTWKTVLDDFKKEHPKLGKKIIYWKPYDFATIEVWLDNKKKLIYNYDSKNIIAID